MASSGGSKAAKPARPKPRPKTVKKTKTPVRALPKPPSRVRKQPRVPKLQPQVAIAVPVPQKGPRKWVIVQLSSNGEREKNIPIIIRAARQILGDKTIEVCVPAVSQKVRDDSHTLFYWDGYVFIEYVEGKPYLRLNETTYFQNVLCQPAPGSSRQKVFSFLSDRDLEPMRKGLEVMKLGAFQEGDDVKIIKGQLKNLIGKVSVVYEGNQSVQVHVGLRSKQMLLDFPSSYLVKVVQ